MQNLLFNLPQKIHVTFRNFSGKVLKKKNVNEISKNFEVDNHQNLDEQEI